MAHKYSIPALDDGKADEVIELLQQRLNAVVDLQLTLRHIAANLVGSDFSGVREMLGEQVGRADAMADELAERIAMLGAEPVGTPGFVAANRTWDDYSLGREYVPGHLAGLDLVYDGVIGDHRGAVDRTGELDRVTQDLLIDQAGELERFQWLARAHLESAGGRLRHEVGQTEREAAQTVTN